MTRWEQEARKWLGGYLNVPPDSIGDLEAVASLAALLERMATSPPPNKSLGGPGD